MSSEDLPPPNDRERIERLERTVGRLKLGVGILLVALVLRLIPPIAAVVGFLLYVAIVIGGLLALITGIIYLLDHNFPGSERKP